MLSISVPNPPPPEDSGSQHLGFRGDPRGLYQQQTDEPTTQRFLVWNEPGSWTGEAGYPGSAHPDDVPYFVSASGMSEPAFMRLVASLSPVPHDPRPEPPGIVVSPNDQLHDGQSVQVTLTHFGPNDRVRLSECFDGGAVTPLGCGEQLARQPFVDTDATGGGSASFVVHRTAPAKPQNTDETFECEDRCVIVATTNLPGTTPAVAELSFE
jgi:hypothetical protein